MSDPLNISTSQKIQKAVVFTLTVLSIFLVLKIISEVKNWNAVVPGANMVSVVGTGEAFAVPDIAQVTFTVDEMAATAGEAQKKATEKNNKTLAYLKSEKIDEKDIQTQSYNVMPQYDYGVYSSVPRAPKIVGYQVTQTTIVKVRDTAKAGNLLTGITNQGVTNISGPALSIDDEDVIMADARSKAIDDAKEKASELAKQLGVRLGKIVSFSESSGGYPVPMYAMEAKLGMGGGGGSPDIATGENKVTVTVNISYQIK